MGAVAFVWVREWLGAGTEHHDEMQIATLEQVAAIAAAVGPRWEAIVFTAAYSGLRWGELAGLRRRDINLFTNSISVTPEALRGERPG